MTNHTTGTREEWLAARLELLESEKELTRRSDELARQRQALPWVRIDKEYSFDTDKGKRSLPDLFQGRSQLLVYHFMFGPSPTRGCPRCSSIADGFDRAAVHLANHDVMFWAVSRASAREDCRPTGSAWDGNSHGPHRGNHRFQLRLQRVRSPGAATLGKVPSTTFARAVSAHATSRSSRAKPPKRQKAGCTRWHRLGYVHS